MKKSITFFLFLNFLLVALPLFSGQAPWGVMDDYVEPRNKEIPLEKFLSGKIIYYFMEEEDGQPAPELAEQMANQSLFLRAVNAWPAYALQQIEKAGRTEEFADLLPLLKQKPNLQRTNDRKQADVQVLFASPSELRSNCDETALACFIFNKLIIVPEVVTYHDKSTNYNEVLSSLIHEVGHFYGMADQYYNGAEKNASAVYSTSDRIDSDNSLMAYSKKLSCDDADGFINLIDITQNRLKGQFSPRAQKGWQSFCDDTLYKKAKVVNRKSYSIGNRTHEYDADGNLKHTHYQAPFFYHQVPLSHLRENRYFMRTLTGDWKLTFYEDEIVFENGKNILSAKREERVDGIHWTFPFMEEDATVTLQENTCRTNLHFDNAFSIFTFFDEQEKIYRTEGMLWNLSNKKSTINTLLTNQSDKLIAYLDSEPAFGEKGVCSLKYDFSPLMTLEGEEITFVDNEVMKKLTADKKLPRTALLLGAIDLCKKMKTQELQRKSSLEESSQFCNFFRNMEEKFYK